MKKIPNYLEKVLEETKNANIRPGRSCHITVYHDGWCDQLNNRGPCNCNPKVGKPMREYRPSHPSRGARALTH